MRVRVSYYRYSFAYHQLIPRDQIFRYLQFRWNVNSHPYAETSEPWSVHLLAVGVRLRSKHLACEVTNRGQTFAIIVKRREKMFEPSPIWPHKATTPSQRTVDKTVKYPIYDRSSRGSSLPTGDGLRNSSPSTWIVPYGGHQQWTHQRLLSLNAQTSGKNVRQQNTFPMQIQRSFPSRSGAPSTLTLDWDM